MRGNALSSVGSKVKTIIHAEQESTWVARAGSLYGRSFTRGSSRGLSPGWRILERNLSLSSSLSCFLPWVSILRARLIIDGGSFGGKLINRAGFYFARHSWLEKGTLLRLLLNSERWFCSCKKWKLDKNSKVWNGIFVTNNYCSFLIFHE